MTKPQKTDADQIKTAHDIDAVRTKYSAVLGRDHLGLVIYHAFMKVILKTFSWSAWWAIHGGFMVEGYVADHVSGEMSWLPFAYGGAAWINFLLRPQFKRLVEALAKLVENWKK